jgi:hypothetical protein
MRRRIESAKNADRLAYAAARDRGDGDPGPNRSMSRLRALALENAERRSDGEALRAQQAKEKLDVALAEHLVTWRETLEAELERADMASSKALERFESVERERLPRAAHAPIAE